MQGIEIDWTLRDAGFTPGVYDKGKVTRPNSQVIALTLLYNRTHPEEQDGDYRWMYNRLTEDLRMWANKPGRRSAVRRQFQEERPTLHGARMPGEFYRPWIEEHIPGATWVATSWIGAKGQFNLTKGTFDGEPTVLARISSDQLIPVFDGIAQYPWNPNYRNVRKVYGYWNIS